MRVRSLKVFTDAVGKKVRSIGEEFEVTKERYEELMKAGDKQPFIEPVEDGDNPQDPPFDSEQLKKENFEESPKSEVDSEFPKHIGGAYYLLSNGEKIKGKEAAKQTENDLKK